MLQCESPEEFEVIFTKIVGSKSGKITKRKFFDLVACAGKTPVQWEEMWPRKEDTLGMDEAMELFECLPELEPFEEGPPLSQIQVPTALITQKVHMATDMRPNEKDELLDVLYEYDKDGLFDFDKISLRGFVLISREIRFTAFRFRLVDPQRVGIIVEIVRNTDMEEKSFVNDIFGVLSDANSDEPIGITAFRNEKGSYTTEPLALKAGDYSIVVMCAGVTFQSAKQTGDGGEQLIDENKKLTKRFKMTLMNTFEMFDWNMDGLLDRKEFDAFNAATGDEPMSDEDWQVLTKHFSLRDGCVPMSAFLQMHQIEADSCEEGNGDFADMWTSLHLIGYDDNLQLKKACPYKLSIDSELPINVVEDFRSCSKEERTVLTAYLFDIADPIEAAPLSVKIYKAQYFGILIADVSTSNADEAFQIKIVPSKGVQMRSAVDLNDFRIGSYSNHVSLAFFVSTNLQWNIDVEFDRVMH
ncbi:unnamed protein product, partial [Mesorhabditis belari]|uniref:EF-hand domain-containing protein n=1 Tax=Mesorhabditis belari TaxID=2138241 RepID=A0AAF3J6W4_9BILA